MSKECSAAIANGLEKQKDSGCLTIPCFVSSFKFEKALCDLGASVSVMPRDVFEKLRLPLEPTGMCLELGDKSIRYPLGIAEDVPVKVEHHFVPVDFVLLEMGEREKLPLILGRLFFKTVGATIDVGKGEIMFDINGERSSFKFRPRLEACNMIEAKNVPPHRRVVKEEPRKKKGLKKKKEPKKKDVKKIKEVVASVKTKEEKPPVKTKKMTKPDEGPIRRTREGSEWEPIKILLEGDEDSNKTNTTSNTRLRLTTQVSQVHVATGVLLSLEPTSNLTDPRTQRNTKPRVH
jgi:hypothetical protein